MIKYIYCYKNKHAGLLTNIFVDPLSPEIKKQQITEEVPLAETKVLQALSEDELVCLGTIDTVSLEIQASKDYVLDLSSICSVALELRNHGQETSSNA